MWLRIKDIKQEILARKLNISNSAVSQIINGKIKKMKSERKSAIALLLNIEPSQLDINPVYSFDNINENSKAGNVK